MNLMTATILSVWGLIAIAIMWGAVKLMRRPKGADLFAAPTMVEPTVEDLNAVAQQKTFIKSASSSAAGQ